MFNNITDEVKSTSKLSIQKSYEQQTRNQCVMRARYDHCYYFIDLSVLLICLFTLVLTSPLPPTHIHIRSHPLLNTRSLQIFR